MSYPPEFVLRVNEVFHDVEEQAYENKHPEILQDEVIRWQIVGRRFFTAREEPISLLDVGSGPGFVPLQLAPLMGKDDRMVCSDISAKMLDVCRLNLQQQDFEPQLHFRKLDGHSLPGECESYDFITMNSVLHHIPEIPAFLAECQRLLRPGGRIIIGHEPNKAFYSHPFLINNSRLTSVAFRPVQAVAGLLRTLGLFEFVSRFYCRINRAAESHNQIVTEISHRLQAEGLIDRPLTKNQLTEIVDIHSPTAGGFHQERGINPSGLLQYLPGFDIEHLETYNHLGKASTVNSVARWYDARLRGLFPNTGATFLVVLRKSATISEATQTKAA